MPRPFAVLTCLSILCAWLTCPTHAGQAADRLSDGTWQKVEEGEMHFRVYCEKKALRVKNGLPVVIYLHGRNWDMMSDDRFLNIPKSCTRADFYKQRPCIVIAPQVPDKGSWNEANLKKVLGILDVIEKHFPVNKNRIYLTGYSMGSDGTYKLLALAPDRFAAAVVAAGRPNKKLAKSILPIPMRAFIGTEDDAPVVNNSRAFAKEMKALKSNDFVLTEFEGLGHNIGDKVFRKTEGLHPWLFKQQRKTK